MNPDTFASKHRMPIESFDKLCRIFHLCLQKDKQRSHDQTVSDKCLVTMELMASATLRWFGGGEHHDIQDFFGMSKSSFYHAAYKVCDAIDQAPELQFDLLMTEEMTI